MKGCEGRVCSAFKKESCDAKGDVDGKRLSVIGRSSVDGDGHTTVAVKSVSFFDRCRLIIF